MVNFRDLVVWLKDVDREDAHLVGGKAANLGEMIQAHFPVPPGFVLTEHAYFTFLKENKLDLKIRHLLGTVHFQDPESLRQVSSAIKKIIISARVPQEIVDRVFTYYEKLDKKKGEPFVAVRSSATSEDSRYASFDGLQETFLNVVGESTLIEKIREAWASLFEPRALFYRHEKKLPFERAGIALVVQKMVESTASGVLFTIDPVTNDKNTVVIEAIYGLGEYIVQGKITPDHYEVDKLMLMIRAKKIIKQEQMLVKKKEGNKSANVSVFLRGKQKITDAQILALAALAKKIENHYYFPQDIEWAYEDETLYIVETRPIITIAKKGEEVVTASNIHATSNSPHPILIGDPASPGIGIGPVKIILHLRDISRVTKGDVLVAPYTNPDYVPAMKKAAGIINERGGRTSHAATVSREFGIPAVVGAARAIKTLREKEIVTVNGSTGHIFRGSIIVRSNKTVVQMRKTKTHVMVNMSEPERAAQISTQNADGVGLLQAEFMIAGIGIHPKKMIEERKQQMFIQSLVSGLKTICEAFYPRPIMYRATDFKTNEYRNLSGGKQFEPLEPNPMLGYRGAFRHIADPRVFNLELQAIRTIREKYGLNNLNLIIPYVRTPHELSEVKRLTTKLGLRRTATFKLYMMVEIPVNVILIEEFIKQEIDGVSIGSNDLTMFMLGTDRDNSEVARAFDERNPAVLWAYDRVIKACKKYGVFSSICGQAPSLYPDLVKFLVNSGIGSISVAPDVIEATREQIFQAEMVKRQ